MRNTKGCALETLRTRWRHTISTNQTRDEEERCGDTDEDEDEEVRRCW
jgi:hypothetical protein